MKKFDYCSFSDDYGFMVDAKKYSKEEALQISKSELGLEDMPNEEFEITDDYIRHTINGGLELDNQPVYISCDKNDRGAFKCWRIRWVGVK